MPLVVFIALGSRGDVQPLAVLASALASAPSLSVALVTHAELEVPLRNGGPAILGKTVEFRGLSLPCFLATSAEAEAAAVPAKSLPCVLDIGGRRRSEWIAAALAARDAAVLVGNLFAMPVVYHLAERLGRPWICASPCLVPYAAPPGFAEEFVTSFPDLYRELSEGARASGPCTWSWRQVKTWLWPLFTENHALLREELLGLPRVPGYDCDDQLTASTLVSGTFLLGLPQKLLREDQELILPDGAVICGSWAPPPEHAPPLPEDLQAYLLRCHSFSQDRPLYIGFGSMGGAGLIPDACEVLEMVCDTARGMQRGAVVLAHLVDGVQAQSSTPTIQLLPGDASWPGLAICRCDVSHQLLLPECSVAVHHGGVGTVFAALAAGIPQLILPLAFDQPHWAQRIQELGVGDTLAFEEVQVSTLTLALKQLLSSTAVVDRAAELGRTIRASDGVAAALAAIQNAVGAAGLKEPLVDPPTDPSKPPIGPAPQPLRLVRRVPLHTGDGSTLVWARCAGEVQYVHDEITVQQCYGDLSAVSTGSLVIDGGSNLGLFALNLARAWEGRAMPPGAGATLTCLAFEPARETYELALRNLREHGVRVVDHGPHLEALEAPALQTPSSPQGSVIVRCFQLALGDVDADEELCFLPNLSSNSTLRKHRDEKELHRRRGAYDKGLVDFFFAEERIELVHCVRLETVLDRLGSKLGLELGTEHGCLPRIGLLKVDVEGAEAAVFRGLGTHWRSVEKLAAEVHSTQALQELKGILSGRFMGTTHATPQRDVADHWMLLGDATNPSEKDPGAVSDREVVPQPKRLRVE